jgi:putative hydrolase of the HAD superfamily
MVNSEITTLFLDIGGVLLTNGWDHNARRRSAEQFGLDYDQMDERHRMTFGTYEEGKVSLERYLRRVVFYEERPFTVDEFTDFMLEQSRKLPETMDRLLELKERHGLRVVAVSNEGRELTEHRVRKFDLCRLFDAFISSCFVHVRKPDEDIFRIALDTSQAEPGHVAYVDDRSMFVEVAAGLGIHGVHHTGCQETLDRLRALGLEAG